MANELYFSYGRRDTSFRSQNGDAVAYNISGTAFIGRELFSPVDRTENRVQIRDNFNLVSAITRLNSVAILTGCEIPRQFSS